MLTLKPFTEDHGWSMVLPPPLGGSGSHLSVSLRLNGFAAHRLAYMLDSLVRVSRRVGWRAQYASVPSAQLVFVHHGVAPARFVPRPPPRHRRETTSRSCPAAVAHADQRPALSGGPAIQPFRIQPGRTRSFHSLPSQQFQALFNSLFKVLFIFPSRYLFAIGLLPIFSLGWNLPPT